MWKIVETNEIKYIFRCLEKSDGVECLLFNFHENLYEHIKYDELYLRVKNLNKRVQFENSAIVETLVEDNVYKVTRKPENVFSFEYQMGFPIIFEWHLAELSQTAFQKNLLLPLIDVMDSMSSQMMKLSEDLEKKDAEIAQYKLEGAILRRKTVATNPFNVNKFNTKFERIKNICNCLKDVSIQISRSESPVQILSFDSSLEQNVNEITPTKLRKRKAVLRAEQAKLITNKLNMEQKTKEVTYLTQSQASTTSESMIPNNVLDIEDEPIVETVCLTSDEEVCIEDKKSTPDSKKIRVRRPRSLPDSQILIKSSPRNLRKSLLFTENDNKEIIKNVKKSPKKSKLHEKNIDLDLEDLFSWKKKTKLDESNTSIAQLMNALKSLDEQRLCRK